jgi:DNA-binding LytR/AlgR family response regulator
MDSWRTSLLFQVLTYLIVYALILTVTYVMDARDSMARQMTETARLSEELSKSQLAALRRQIDCIEAAGRYACLHAGNDTHIMRRTLSELERNLGEEKFILIHRSTIVQLDRIHGLELQSGGDYEVILKCKSRLPLSRRFRKRLQDRVRAM